jgi:orotidine-5'-phosphate decarboxylase
VEEPVPHPTGRERLIVALDVPSVQRAATVVDRLSNISFFKIGWELFLAGVMKGELRALLDQLSGRRIFLDLKVPGDIDNTVGAIVGLCVEAGNIEFLTLSESTRARTIRAAADARKGGSSPRLLTVPLLSSLDASDLRQELGPDVSAEDYIVRRATASIQAGCDGVIASGRAIQACRERLPEGALIVSPGIRPSGGSINDHKRSSTPAQAIAAGSDYLVVGRPILQAPDPQEAAREIIDEMDAAFRDRAALFHVEHLVDSD